MARPMEKTFSTPYLSAEGVIHSLVLLNSNTQRPRLEVVEIDPEVTRTAQTNMGIPTDTKIRTIMRMLVVCDEL